MCATSSNGESMVWVAERWTGLTWSIQSPASPDDCQDTHSGSCSNGLGGVSCTARTVCTAVGGFAEVTLAKRWNGSKWSTQSTPNPPGPAAAIQPERSAVCVSDETCGPERRDVLARVVG